MPVDKKATPAKDLCPCGEEPRRGPGRNGLACEAAAKRLRRAKAAKSPLRYEVQPLSKEDGYIAGVPKDGSLSAAYSRQKRQEYARAMAHTTEMLEELATAPDDKRIARYNSDLAEDERRWLGRRTARSSAIGHAREVLLVRMFEDAARRVQWKLKPYGCSRKHHTRGVVKRILNVLCTDQHTGWKSPKEEGPEAYDLISSARSFAQVTLQVCEYKPQYRDETECNLLFGGDGFEGLLGHGPERDNYTLTEQMVAFGQYAAAMIARVAEVRKVVNVWFAPGNHGRNKLVHHGRATSSKWDSFETVVMLFVQQQCAPLKNVRFHITKAPAQVVPLFDKRMLFTHGDTELRLGSPSTKAATWESALNAVNGDLRYGCRIDLLAAGHFHDPRVMHFAKADAICNGALVPANGYARALGFASVPGQFIWESVPGYAVGDVRFVRVDCASRDASLDKIIPPYAWGESKAA